MKKEQTGLKIWIGPTLVGLVLCCLLIIGTLVIALKIASKRLANIALVLEETAEQHIIANVDLNTNLPLNSNFQINDDVRVGIDMVVETLIPIHVEIPVNENILVPFKIGVKDYIKLDTTILITDDVYAMVEDTLYLDQKCYHAHLEKKRNYIAHQSKYTLE